jgi:hypothetical protein
MGYRQFVQNLLALRGKLHQHLPSIVRVASSFYEPEMLKAIDKPDRTVVPNQKSFGKMADGRQNISWKSLEDQQSLMLLCFDSERLRGFLTEVEEASDLKPKFFELSKFRELKVETAVPHIYIVARYKISRRTRASCGFHRSPR